MDETVLGEAGTAFPDVRRIALLRGGGLGDLMFAMPAAQALAAAYPAATITLLGTPAHRRLLEGRPGPIADVVELPAAHGVRDGEEDPDELARFFAAMRDRAFDLAVQVHGGGRFSNPFLLELGARFTVGTRTEDAAMLDRSLDYVLYQHEMLRALEVVGLAGAAPVGLEPRLTVLPSEREGAATLLGASADERDAHESLLVLHPGATDPRRRWRAERFGELAALAAGAGWRVVVVGDDGDVPASHAIVRAAGTVGPAGLVESLAGRLSLGELVGVLAAATVVVGNDSGPRHLAAAVGTPTVGLYWVGNLVNAGPLSRGRHRVHLSWTTQCPVCDVDVTQVGWTAPRCAHDPSYLDRIGAGEVWEDVLALER